MHFGSIDSKETADAPAVAESFSAAGLPLPPSSAPMGTTPSANPETKNGSSAAGNTSSSTADNDHSRKKGKNPNKPIFHPFTCTRVSNANIGREPLTIICGSMPINPDTGKLEAGDHAVTYRTYQKRMKDKGLSPKSAPSLSDFINHEHRKEIQLWMIAKYCSKGLPNKKTCEQLLNSMEHEKTHPDVIEYFENQMHKKTVEKTGHNDPVHPITGNPHYTKKGTISKKNYCKNLPANPETGSIDATCQSFQAYFTQYKHNLKSNKQPNPKPKMANISKFLALENNDRINVMKKMATDYFRPSKLNKSQYKPPIELLNDLLKGMTEPEFKEVRNAFIDEVTKLYPTYKSPVSRSSSAGSGAGAGAGDNSKQKNVAIKKEPSPRPIILEHQYLGFQMHSVVKKWHELKQPNDRWDTNCHHLATASLNAIAALTTNEPIQYERISTDYRDITEDGADGANIAHYRLVRLKTESKDDSQTAKRSHKKSAKSRKTIVSAIALPSQSGLHTALPAASTYFFKENRDETLTEHTMFVPEGNYPKTKVHFSKMEEALLAEAKKTNHGGYIYGTVDFGRISSKTSGHKIVFYATASGVIYINAQFYPKNPTFFILQDAMNFQSKRLPDANTHIYYDDCFYIIYGTAHVPFAIPEIGNAATATVSAGAPANASTSRLNFFSSAPAPMMPEKNNNNDAKQAIITVKKEPIDADETTNTENTSRFFKAPRKRKSANTTVSAGAGAASTTLEEDARSTKRLKPNADDSSSLPTLESVHSSANNKR